MDARLNAKAAPGVYQAMLKLEAVCTTLWFRAFSSFAY